MTAESHIVVGTAGHIDHGKSTLVQALTGTDPDRWEEEKRRGITIDLGFAFTEIEGLPFSFVDVPGHERFVHNMLAGATGIDLVLLVVAADESVMPQTREHLAICSLLGLRGGVIALTRTDLAAGDYIDLVEEEVRETVLGTFLERAEIVRVSGKTGAGIDRLRAALLAAARALPRVSVGPWPRLPIDRVFASKGFGTVVTGTLQGGELRVGQPLIAIPGERKARIRGLQVHGKALESVGPHRRVAVNLQAVDREQLHRGMVLVPEGREIVTRVFDARATVISGAPTGLAEGQRVRVHHGTAEVLARVRLGEGGVLEPGEEGSVQIRLETPLAALPGDRFILRRYSPVVTLGGGRIADLDPPRWRRGDRGWKERARRLAQASPLERLEIHVGESGTAGWPLKEAPRLALDPDQIGSTPPAGMMLLAGERLISEAAAAELLEAVVRELEREHRNLPLSPGPAPDQLRARCAKEFSPAAFREFLLRGEGWGALVYAREAVRRPDHQARPEGAEAERLDALVAALEGHGLKAVPEQELLAGAPGDGELLRWAERAGRAVRLSNGSWVAGGPWREMIRTLHGEAREGRRVIDVPAFKGLFGLSRKYAIPILEKLDDQGVTRRAGNQRVIRPPDVDRGGES